MTLDRDAIVQPPPPRDVAKDSVARGGWAAVAAGAKPRAAPTAAKRLPQTAERNVFAALARGKADAAWDD